MKTKVFRKISALILAGMMTAAMSVTAFAAGDEGRTVDGKYDTVSGSDSTINLVTTTDNTIPLTKSIIFFNADGSEVFEPNITFNYTVAPAGVTDEQYTVKDSSNNVVHVYNGVTGGVAGTSIEFGTNIGGTATSAVTAAATGTEVERTGKLTVDTTKFSHAGVYRYVITEADLDVTAVGLTDRDATAYQTTRYLDVYIKNDGNALALYGAVIFKSFVTTSGTDSVTETTDKNSGFGPVGSSDYANDKTVDKYTTYNVTVKKVVAGNLADKTHEFPFYVELSNTIAGAKYTYTDDNSNFGAEVVSGTTIAKGTDASNSALTLKHNEFIKFVGVPSNQTNDLVVEVKEWNNSVDKYTSSAAASNGATVNVTNSTMDNGAAAEVSALTVKQDTANLLLTVTNTITDISPTGLVLRFAPFAIMAGFGIFFLILSRKHHKKENRDII